MKSREDDNERWSQSWSYRRYVQVTTQNCAGPGAVLLIADTFRSVLVLVLGAVVVIVIYAKLPVATLKFSFSLPPLCLPFTYSLLHYFLLPFSSPYAMPPRSRRANLYLVHHSVFAFIGSIFRSLVLLPDRHT